MTVLVEKSAVTLEDGIKTLIMSGNGGTIGGSCWGFIVKEDMKTKYGQPKFKKGDILKPAGWNKPATNSARGNVLDGMYEINWTGPMYLS